MSAPPPLGWYDVQGGGGGGLRHRGRLRGNSSRGTVRELVHASSRIVRLAAGSCYLAGATIGAAFPPPSHLPAPCVPFPLSSSRQRSEAVLFPIITF